MLERIIKISVNSRFQVISDCGTRQWDPHGTLVSYRGHIKQKGRDGIEIWHEGFLDPIIILDHLRCKIRMDTLNYDGKRKYQKLWQENCYWNVLQGYRNLKNV